MSSRIVAGGALAAVAGAAMLAATSVPSNAFTLSSPVNGVVWRRGRLVGTWGLGPLSLLGLASLLGLGSSWGWGWHRPWDRDGVGVAPSTASMGAAVGDGVARGSAKGERGYFL
jgi:hypothetical protein